MSEGARDNGDRREHARVRSPVIIDYATVDHFFRDYALNISLGGIFIRTEEVLPVGTQLKIHFSIPELEDFIDTTGVVVRTIDVSDGEDPKGMGIAFEDLEAEAKALLDGLVEKLQS
jgi:uncharacterized protein (TIGR02266 family)